MNTQVYLIVDDLKNLQKVVELLVLKHGLETLLKMKPVLKFEDGKIIPEEKKFVPKKRAIQTLERKY